MSASDSGADPLARLADEFLERHRRGERPAVSEYTARHPELAEQIRELFSALLVMEDVRPAPPPADDVPGAGDAPRHLGEYRIVRQIGRGGMGVVYEAEQESLGRRVALKVLPPGALGDAAHVERFQREARAAARLHHTNIVPVFGVGEDSGTHYYVMQYIDGRPLDEVLVELRRLRDEAARGAAPPAAANPSSAQVARSLWLGHVRPPSRPPARDADDPEATEAPEPPGPARPGPGAPRTRGPGSATPLSDPHRPYAKSVAHLGVQVAEALEYAAGQGVLHRDVKPSNLLLDVWGTVWLTDFGLAKASGTPDLTRPGDLLGTLRYMAPERFAGRADVRSDVYALGLTLYELLALRPAFGEAGRAELIGQITTAEPPRLERLAPGLPRDLVTVVHKAMARHPGDRYQSPGALAEELRRFLDDRPIAARRLSLLEYVWRGCKRHPLRAALGVALLAVVALAVTGVFWWQRQQGERRERAARARQGVEVALEQAAGLRRDGRWPEARAVLQRARAWLDGEAPDGQVADELRRRLERARADLNLVAGLEAVRLKRATRLAGKFDPTWVDRAYTAAFAEAGLAVRDEVEAVAARIRASALREQLVAALDDWAVATRDLALQARLLGLSRRADRGRPWRERLREPGLWVDRRALERLAREVPPEVSPQLLVTLTAVLEAVGADSEPLRRTAQGRHPGDFWINYDLANLLSKAKPAEAVGFYRVALALRPKDSSVHINLGLALADAGQLDEAIKVYHRALDLDPGLVWVHINLGVALRDAGRVDEAIKAYRRALELDPNLAGAHNNLGIALRDQGRLREAIAAHRRALELDPRWSMAHSNLGVALADNGQMAEAVAEYRRALQLDPKNVLAHNGLGVALASTGRWREAIEKYGRALELNPRYARAHNNLGVALDATGQVDQAIAAYRQAIALDPRYARAHSNLGISLEKGKGRVEEGIAAYRKAIALDPRLAEAHVSLSQALVKQGEFTEARAAAQRGLGLLSANHSRRPFARLLLGLCDRLLALEARLPAILEGQQQPANAAEQRDLAVLCWQYRKRYAAAARFYADAFAAQPRIADNLQSQHRYHAARAAALAAAGQGTDAANLGDGERNRLRRQALKWLAADLEAWARLIKDSPRDQDRARKTLRKWQADGDLAGIRDAGRMARLPPEEQEACWKLWAEVDAMLQRPVPGK
jgi:tetratricopeptide (TPR) repeat protein